ncbi:hypothetical protein [Haloarcula sp. CBA1127]|uniref:cupredoxin domain-containing protein n=1 Tax=Haloarcula sp. CBA1127 TaxID=1765055 RepID=UPI00073F96CD|nr:hypothetical protein [Haloarcula sp. CBA1127]
MRRVKRRTVLGSVPLVIGLAGCSSENSADEDDTATERSSATDVQSTTAERTAAPTPASENTIHMGVDDENHVAPDSITIQSGEGVHFQAVSGNHEIYCTHDRPDGGKAWSFRLEEGESRGVVIEVTGRYEYHCAFHDRDGGAIIVE